MGKTLAAMADEVYEVNVQLGWQPSSNTFGDCMALLHSEVSEALEAYRDQGLADATKTTRQDEHHDRLHGLCIHGEPRGDCDRYAPDKPEGVGSEFADVLIRLLDDCKMYGVDLEAEYERKIAYNRTRAWRHGGRGL